MTVEELYVNGFDNNEVQWDEVGSSPYLHDSDVDYIRMSSVSYLYESRFTFPNSGGSGTINSVKIRVKAKQDYVEIPGTITVYVWTGSAWQSIGNITPATSYTWYELDASSILNTWDKINTAKVRFRGSAPDTPDGIIYVNRCTRKVDYAVAGVAIGHSCQII
jgi:hypothetical protein